MVSRQRSIDILVGNIDQRRNDSGLALLSSAPNAAHCCQANRSSTSWLRKRDEYAQCMYRHRLCSVKEVGSLDIFCIGEEECLKHVYY